MISLDGMYLKTGIVLFSLTSRLYVYLLISLFLISSWISEKLGKTESIPSPTSSSYSFFILGVLRFFGEPLVLVPRGVLVVVRRTLGLPLLLRGYGDFYTLVDAAASLIKPTYFDYWPFVVLDCFIPDFFGESNVLMSMKVVYDCCIML